MVHSLLNSRLMIRMEVAAGIDRSRVEDMETRLRADVLREVCQPALPFCIPHGSFSPSVKRVCIQKLVCMFRMLHMCTSKHLIAVSPGWNLDYISVLMARLKCGLAISYDS